MAPARLPVVPTILVALAVAVMIGLGVWQLQRKAEKDALLARYAAAQGLPPIAWPRAVDPAGSPLFRRSSVRCLGVGGWRSQSGRNRAGDSGWAHVATCRTETGSAQVVAGWSNSPANPDWRGGFVTGVIGADRDHGIKLVADTAPPGLQPARPPSTAAIPNNHLLYALQWFFFAAAAAVIYLLALRRRTR